MAGKKAVNIKEISRGRKNVHILRHGDLHIEPGWNERNLGSPEVKAHIESIALSLSEKAKNGIATIEPPVFVVARADKVAITDGHCRHAAAALAEKKHKIVVDIPVMVEERGTKDADHVVSMITRNGGLKLAFHEQARVIGRMIDHGWDKKKIAAYAGCSITHVDNCMLLLGADPKIMKLMDSGKVSGRLAIMAIRQKSVSALGYIENEIGNAEKAGKGKATQRTARKKAPTPPASNPSSTTEKPVAWGIHGPEFFGLLEQLEKAFDGAHSMPDSVGDIVTFYKQYKEDNSLEAKKG